MIERRETRPCASCGKAIISGQLYVAAGPRHVYCDPPPRLDVLRVAQAASGR